MECEIRTEKKPIRLWLPEPDKDTLQQAKNLANIPGIVSHVALMPDAHVGYGMPIGGVAATDGIVIPNAVGVDIGCGVCAVKTGITEVKKEELKTVMAAIRRRIPLGFSHHRQAQAIEHMPKPGRGYSINDLPVINGEYANARTQLGTLGSGNHFIEFQIDQSKQVWLMIHSGSRNLGFKVAHHYNELARKHTLSKKLPIPSAWQLDFLPVHSESGQLYLAEMEFCVEFARANRMLMLSRICDILQDMFAPVNFSNPIHIAHNYAAEEMHFGRLVLVHRKGATRAFKGEIGIIPGSQGSESYIVEGLGNEASFCSCSHGAGRRLGRKQAMQQLDLQKEMRRLDQLGVIHAVRSKRDLEEAAGAYKDINEVLRLQSDLVIPLVRLQPLAVIKG